MKISIVTPSFQQGPFLEEAMRSVLDQGYPDLEYIVTDGGSTDNSAEIIRKYADRLHWWVSERDAGQYDALNKGFSHATGEVMGWLNSDDKLTPWCLSVVEEIFSTLPEVEWITTLAQIRWDSRGRAVRCLPQRGFSRAGFFAGENLPTAGLLLHFVDPAGIDLLAPILVGAGGARMRGDLYRAADFELWARFYKQAELYGVDTPLGGFRMHGNQKESEGYSSYWAEAEPALREHGGRRHGWGARLLRRLACQSCPPSMQAFAGSIGLLYPGKICRHNRHTGRWQIVPCWA